RRMDPRETAAKERRLEEGAIPLGEHYVLVGAGQAGCQAAVTLRQSGFEGDITLIGEEDALPYQRPPLSKAYLKGELGEDRLYFRTADFYESQDITLKLGARVSRIDREAKVVSLSHGENVAYDKLLIATGAPARRLTCEGANLKGVYSLRTLKDSQSLSAILTGDGPVIIIGAGYIGLEVAAVARAAGREVTVLEMADRVLARVAAPELSSFYHDLHTEQGVRIRYGAAVTAIRGENGAVASVELSDGEQLPASSVLVGIGAFACIDIAEEAGLECSGGIVVDEHARTADPHIYAAGDCTIFPSARYGRRLRLESVPNAIEQAKAAGANMAGGSALYDPLPWFWSDQYDVKLQTVGLAAQDGTFVTRGDPEAKRFSLWCFDKGELVAVDAVNDPAAFAAAKKVLTVGSRVEPEEVANPDFDLRELMKR
ncbi:MAG: FAD-dependent oxidoreductase, partial [Pseudomonadota bacterium]